MNTEKTALDDKHRMLDEHKEFCEIRIGKIAGIEKECIDEVRIRPEDDIEERCLDYCIQNIQVLRLTTEWTDMFVGGVCPSIRIEFNDGTTIKLKKFFFVDEDDDEDDWVCELAQLLADAIKRMIRGYNGERMRETDALISLLRYPLLDPGQYSKKLGELTMRGSKLG